MDATRPDLDDALRVIRANGAFAFTIQVPPNAGDRSLVEPTSGVTVFMHSRQYIDACIARHNFVMRKGLPFYIGNKSAGVGDLFHGLVIQRSG